MANEIENEQINAVRSNSDNYKIKSYMIFIILILVVLLVILFLGRLGNDVFALFTFLLIFLIPVLVLFRNKLPGILPKFLKDSLVEIDDRTGYVPPVYSFDKKTKENGYLFGIVVLLIASVLIIADYRNKMEDGMTAYRIFVSVICLIFAALMLTNLTGEELELGIGEEEESV
jgi:cytochrome bd-type quinol oxidase subunit 2